MSGSNGSTGMAGSSGSGGSGGKSRLGIGVDFGTSNSAAATFDGEQVRLAQLEPAALEITRPARTGPEAGAERDGAIMPSAAYIDRERRTRTGREAVQRYVADNTGRRVELVPEVVGKALLAVGNGSADARNPGDSVAVDVYGEATSDVGMQGRLFLGTKRLLGRADSQRLMVFDQPFRLVALITPILLRIRRALAAQRGGAGGGCAGHPVHFEGREQFRNQLALSRLGEAYGYAGFGKPRFFPEPIAAAVSFLHARPGVDGDHLLGVDFGGGTLDFCVLERERPGLAFRVLATHGIALGGDHIDRRLFRELLFPLLGRGERWTRPGEYGDIDTLFPFEDFEELLLNWAVTYLLNQNRYMSAVQSRIAQGGPARRKFRRLRELIQQNLGYMLFQAIRDLKARLSAADEAVLDIPEIDVALRLTRAGFERMIADMLARIEQAVAHVLASAKLPPTAIDIVLRSGGSSLIPAVHGLLEERFPARVVDHDPFTGVAAGLAIADYHQLPAA